MKSFIVVTLVIIAIGIVLSIFEDDPQSDTEKISLMVRIMLFIWGLCTLLP